MKKVAVSKQSSFDDPLFNPGDSFNVRDSDEYIAPVVSRTSAPELVNTLTASDEDSFLSTPKPMKTNKSKPTPIPSSVPVVVKEKEKTPQIVEKPKPTQKADPLKAVSVFENEGEDLFLPSSGGQKKKSEPNFEEELFGHSSSSPSELREVKLEEKNLRLGTHDSDRDHEVSERLNTRGLILHDILILILIIFKFTVVCDVCKCKYKCRSKIWEWVLSWRGRS